MIADDTPFTLPLLVVSDSERTTIKFINPANKQVVHTLSKPLIKELRTSFGITEDMICEMEYDILVAGPRNGVLAIGSRGLVQILLWSKADQKFVPHKQFTVKGPDGKRDLAGPAELVLSNDGMSVAYPERLSALKTGYFWESANDIYAGRLMKYDVTGDTVAKLADSITITSPMTPMMWCDEGKAIVHGGSRLTTAQLTPALQVQADQYIGAAQLQQVEAFARLAPELGATNMLFTVTQTRLDGSPPAQTQLRTGSYIAAGPANGLMMSVKGPSGHILRILRGKWEKSEDMPAPMLKDGDLLGWDGGETVYFLDKYNDPPVQIVRQFKLPTSADSKPLREFKYDPLSRISFLGE